MEEKLAIASYNNSIELLNHIPEIFNAYRCWETKRSDLSSDSIWGTFLNHVHFWSRDKVNREIRLFHEQKLSWRDVVVRTTWWSHGVLIFYIPSSRYIYFSVCSLNACDSCIAYVGNLYCVRLNVFIILIGLFCFLPNIPRWIFFGIS